jgi:hypothetical protein
MIDQIGIALTGVTAVFLTQSKAEPLRRYACLFGMAGQPFWFYAAITAEQWGIVVLNCLYTLAWGKGIWTHWLAPSHPPVMVRGEPMACPCGKCSPGGYFGER